MGIYNPVTQLSQIAIDTDKDWDAKKIENLGAPDSGDDAKRHDSTPETHGAAQHTDITREIFLPAHGGYIVSGTLSEGGFVCGEANVNEPLIDWMMKVPLDFVSFVSMRAIWNCGVAAGNMYWELRACYAVCGEDCWLNDDTPGFGVTATGGADIRNCQEPANPLTLASLAVDDFIVLTFNRLGANALDTLDADVYFEGLLFTYVANQ